MSDDHASEQRSRQRLEAIVFGRDAAVSDAEQVAAGEELARLIAADAVDLPEPEMETATEPEPADRQPDQAQPELADLQVAAEIAPTRRRWRVLIAVLAGALAVTLAVIVVALLVRPSSTRTDSMAIFDRPQTEQDLILPAQFPPEWVIAESVRFVGSEAGYDVFVFLQDTPARPAMLEGNPEPTATPVPSEETIRQACMLVVESETMTSGTCRTPEEFASGLSIPFSSNGMKVDVSWNIDDGLVVRSETIPPVPPASSVFDEEQDDADLNALAYLPDIPPSQQDTVRFIGSSAGYYVAAYRDADDAVCLAVYEGGTMVATSESVCVTEEEFEEEGIQLIYPAAAPEISVTWGVGPGVAFGGR